MNYDELNKALKYSDESTVRNIASSMTFHDWLGDHPDADQTKRKVLADAYQEHTGDDAGAELLRNESQPVAFHKGKMHKGVIRHRDINGGSSQDYDEESADLDPLRVLMDKGPDEALHHALMAYDVGEGTLSEDFPYGDGGESHTSDDGRYTFSWNPNGYWGLVEHHIVPEHLGDRTYWHNGKYLNH